MLNPDFKEFIQSLNDSGVRYLVVGGYAVAFHGHPRYTKDLDIWLWLDESNAQKVLQALPFIDLDNLRKNKQASGRLQDLADLESLE